MQKNIVKTFVTFLKSNKAFKEFTSNLINDAEFRERFGDFIDPTEYLTYKLNKEPSLVLMDAFAWGDTQEGFDFWDNIDVLWRKNLK